MRGEYIGQPHGEILIAELPPHARRILIDDLCYSKANGTTSACAENTAVQGESHTVAGNYLRMRGEYIIFVPAYADGLELPPHARRIRNILVTTAR